MTSVKLINHSSSTADWNKYLFSFFDFTFHIYFLCLLRIIKLLLSLYIPSILPSFLYFLFNVHILFSTPISQKPTEQYHHNQIQYYYTIYLNKKH